MSEDKEVSANETEKSVVASLESEGKINETKVRKNDQHIDEKYDVDSRGRYSLKNSPDVEFRDLKNRIITKHQTATTAQDMVSVADAKGWENMKVSGTEKFRREAWLEAESRGILVKGYKPTEKDVTQLEEKRNTLEKTDNPFDKGLDQGKYNELKVALENKNEQSAIKAQPELENIYKAHKAISEFANREIHNEQRREAFVARFTDDLVKAAASGKTIPNPEREKNLEVETELER